MTSTISTISSVNNRILGVSNQISVNTFIDSSGTWTQYIFTNTSSSANLTISTTTNKIVNIFCIGGGGGGGSDIGGGGGAGGFLQKSITLTNAYSSETFTVTVGSGGLRCSSNTTLNNGQNSSVNFLNNTQYNMLAYGGGGGASSCANEYVGYSPNANKF